MFDSYLGDELLVETNHEVLRHLENCAACRRELADRRELRKRIRSAVISSSETQINAAFAIRLQTNLHSAAFEPNVWGRLRRGEIFNLKFLTAVTAGIIIVAVAGTIWLNRSRSMNETATLVENSEPNETSQIPQPVESPIIKAVEAAWREITQAAIGDHENCAVKFRLAEDPITLEEAAAKFGSYNKDLDKVVIAAISRQNPAAETSEKIKFVEAHSCVFEGRRFAHVVLKYHNRLVSILVTDTDLPLSGEGVSSQQNGDKTSVASFRVAHQAIFIVSDLNETGNMTVANAISLSIRQHIERAAA